MKKLNKILCVIISAIIVISSAFSSVSALSKSDVKTDAKSTLAVLSDSTIKSDSTDVMYGDVNEDKNINMEDVVIIQKHIAKLNILEGSVFKAADVTNDGVITMLDVTTLQKYIVKIINKFPCEDENSDVTTDTASDANTDTTTDTASDVNTDANTDTSSDTNADTTTDISSDTNADTTTDTSSDANTNTNTDTTTDTSSDTNTDTTTDTSSDTNTDTTTDTSSDANNNFGTDTEPVSEGTYFITLDIERFDWEHVYAYLWEETVPQNEGESSQFVSEPAAFPGIEMTRDPATGYYILDVSMYTNCNKVLFSNGKNLDAGGQQTENLNLIFMSGEGQHYILLGYIKYW